MTRAARSSSPCRIWVDSKWLYFFSLCEYSETFEYFIRKLFDDLLGNFSVCGASLLANIFK